DGIRDRNVTGVQTCALRSHTSASDLSVHTSQDLAVILPRKSQAAAQLPPEVMSWIGILLPLYFELLFFSILLLRCPMYPASCLSPVLSENHSVVWNMLRYSPEFHRCMHILSKILSAGF